MADEQNDDGAGPSSGGTASTTEQFLARFLQPVLPAKPTSVATGEKKKRGPGSKNKPKGLHPEPKGVQTQTGDAPSASKPPAEPVTTLVVKWLVAEKPVLSEEEKAAGQSAAHHPAQITLFWRMLKGRPVFDEKLSEWNRLAHVAIVMVGTSVADERTFSIMKFVTDQRPSLTTHLELTVRAAEQTVFSMGTFPLDQAREEWVKTVQK